MKISIESYMRVFRESITTAFQALSGFIFSGRRIILRPETVKSDVRDKLIISACNWTGIGELHSDILL